LLLGAAPHPHGQYGWGLEPARLGQRGVNLRLDGSQAGLAHLPLTSRSVVPQVEPEPHRVSIHRVSSVALRRRSAMTVREMSGPSIPQWGAGPTHGTA